jgi:ABC-type transporter Mla maintaining outer membrane lipid asymmetry permease subunit MlaE
MWAWPLFALIGLVFGALAAAMAFLTTYAEYSRYPYLPRRAALKQALQMAGATLLFFVLLALGIGGVVAVTMRPP